MIDGEIKVQNAFCLCFSKNRHPQKKKTAVHIRNHVNLLIFRQKAKKFAHFILKNETEKYKATNLE